MVYYFYFTFLKSFSIHPSVEAVHPFKNKADGTLFSKKNKNKNKADVCAGGRTLNLAHWLVAADAPSSVILGVC